MSSGIASVRVVKNKWTTVVWGYGIFATSYTLSGPRDRKIEWRWFSASYLPYMQGSFVGRGTVAMGGFIYFNIQVKAPIDCTITVT